VINIFSTKLKEPLFDVNKTASIINNFLSLVLDNFINGSQNSLTACKLFLNCIFFVLYQKQLMSPSPEQQNEESTHLSPSVSPSNTKATHTYK
jgi:hypothetical protein